jgi:MinD superfamily P-loop ATPase
VHAGLFPGAENSGKLVTLVKSQAVEVARAQGVEAILVDGPPGIGCPVIAATAGANAILAVTEPTPAGIHDLERLLDLAAHFRIPTVQVCINKYDLHLASTKIIETLCSERNIPIAGRIPFDESVVQSMMNGQPFTTDPASPAGHALRSVWEQVLPSLTP